MSGYTVTDMVVQLYVSFNHAILLFVTRIREFLNGSSAIALVLGASILVPGCTVGANESHGTPKAGFDSPLDKGDQGRYAKTSW